MLDASHGWPMGVALTSLAGSGEAAAALPRDELFGFLAEEVIDRLAPAARLALVDSSVPAMLTPSLAEALGLPPDFIGRNRARRALPPQAPLRRVLVPPALPRVPARPLARAAQRSRTCRPAREGRRRAGALRSPRRVDRALVGGRPPRGGAPRARGARPRAGQDGPRRGRGLARAHARGAALRAGVPAAPRPRPLGRRAPRRGARAAAGGRVRIPGGRRRGPRVGRPALPGRRALLGGRVRARSPRPSGDGMPWRTRPPPRPPPASPGTR